MRRSPWYTVTGLDYIRTAFKVAREVLPGAKLCVNDYNTTVPAKRDGLYALVAELKGEGVPIDCVGHQMHINVNWPSTADTEAAIAKFVPLGVTQQITEMDVSVYTADGESFPAPPADRLPAQAYKYRDMFALFREYASAISSVTLWGLADDNTWLDTFPVTRKDAPLLFDTALQAKPAYWGVVDPSRIGTATPASPPVSQSSATGNPTDWPPSPSTSSGTTACSVAYRVVATWPGGFLADVKLTNTGTVPYLNWYVSWQFGAGQTITQLWNGSLTETGNGAIVRNTSWNGQVAAGASVSFGFLGSWTGGNPVPTAFGSNGKSCTIA
jgi:endo-1,4-beta-xylanase